MQGGLVNERRGLLIKTPSGVGEIAPLPYFSPETYAEALAESKVMVRALNNGTTYTPTLPSCAMAWLMLHFPLRSFEPTKPYKFVLGSPAQTPQIITPLYTSGARVFKLKVGLYAWNDECKLLTKLVDYFPLAKFIIDANCTLSLKDAQNIVAILGPQLLYLEDPCSDLESSCQIVAPLGLDELARSNILEFFSTHAPNLPSSWYLVQKPTLNLALTTQILPNIINTPKLHSKLKLDALNQHLILSSSFESVIGIRYLERLSTALKLNPPGTDTLKYFAHQAWTEETFWATCTKEETF